MGVGGWGWLSAESAGFWPGAAAAATYISKVLGYSPIAYWPQNEASGATAICQVNSPAQDGTYTGVTLGETGIGDGETCPLFDGANDYNDVQTATMAGVFDGQEGSILVWAKVSGAGAWTDSASRRMATVYADAQNFLTLQKHATNNRIKIVYEANNVQKEVLINGVSSTDWMCWVLSWTLGGDAFKAYLGGVQQGATATGLGTWAGSPATSLVGAWSGPIQVWDGWLAHVALFDSALGQAAITDLAVV